MQFSNVPAAVEKVGVHREFICHAKETLFIADISSLSSGTAPSLASSGKSEERRLGVC